MRQSISYLLRGLGAGVWLRFALYIFITLAVFGCAVKPQQLGISQQTWLGYSKAQQKQLAASYNQQHNYFIQQAQFDNEQGANLRVLLLQGKAMMPPFKQAQSFKPAEVLMSPGSCQQVWLYALQSANSKTSRVQRVQLQLCYRNKVLSLDPSFYQLDKKQGSLFIHYHPGWWDGMTYSGIHSSGYLRLQHTSMRLHLLAPQAVGFSEQLFVLGPR